MGSEMKAEIVRFMNGKYGVRLKNGRYSSVTGTGNTWEVPRPDYCQGTLEQAKDTIATYKEPVVVDLDREPAEPAKQPPPRRITIDRHDLYFFLAAQIVVILLAGVYFK